MTQELEYTYKLYRDVDNGLVVTVDPLVKDIEKSIEKMMDMNIDELSEDNKQLFDLKILGLRTIHQFLGALQQEQYLKDTAHELKGRVNIKIDEDLNPLGLMH